MLPMQQSEQRWLAGARELNSNEATAGQRVRAMAVALLLCLSREGAALGAAQTEGAKVGWEHGMERKARGDPRRDAMQDNQHSLPYVHQHHTSRQA